MLPKEPPHSRQLHVLIIEDDFDFARAVIANLSKAGYDCRHAISSFGWDAFRANEPDLVLLDLLVPGMDGYELYAGIRQSSSVGTRMFTINRADGAAKLKVLIDCR